MNAAQNGLTVAPARTVMSELPTEAALTSFFADYILDCVVEALDEVVDPLILYKILKRAV
jgi:hypothetical protein